METHSRILAWRNPIDRGVWWATVHAGAKEWDSTEHAHIPAVDTRCAAAADAKSLQSCPTLSDPMDRSLAGSSVHGTLQARVLEWVAIAFSSTQGVHVNKYVSCVRLSLQSLQQNLGEWRETYSFLLSVTLT